MSPKQEYDPNYPIPFGPEPGIKDLEFYLNAEYSSMPSSNHDQHDMNVVRRERAVVVIYNVSMRENLEPSVPYLAVNYFDLYLSGDNALPRVMEIRDHDLELLCICCLTIACKMRDNNFPIIRFKERHSDLEAIHPVKFYKMELNILKGIKWNLRPVTPLCFVRFLAPELPTKYGIRRRTINQIIINSQNEIKITLFRPSVVAASALLAASSFLYPRQFPSFVDIMASKEIFKREELKRCTRRLIKMCVKLNLVIESAVAVNRGPPGDDVAAGPSTWTQRPGKEKFGEDEDDAAAMGFALRWSLGETGRDDFVIFPDVEGPAEVAAAEDPAEAGVFPVALVDGFDLLHVFCYFCCCFCCCHSHNPF